MDIQTRGLISASINATFETVNTHDVVDWVLEADSQVVSREDLALGYFMGALMNIADETLKKGKAGVWLVKSLERKLGKKRAREILEETRAKGGRRTKPVETTREEQQEIREMLIPMIAQFREKIRKEEALRRV